MASPLLGVLVGALALLAPPSQANLVQNGSFENATTSTTVVFSAAGLTDWTNTIQTPQGDALVHPSWFSSGFLFPGVGVAGALPATSPDGGNWVFSDGNFQNSPIKQTLTGLTPGNFYQLSFYQGLIQDTEIGITTPGPVSGGWRVSLGTSTWVSPTMTGNGATLTFSNWALQTTVLQANNSTEVLSFMAFGTGDPPLVLLDGVMLEAVPEPGAVALWSLGLVALGALYRKRRWQDLAP